MATRSGAVKRITSVRDLTPDDRNANKGTLRGSAMIEQSFQDHGAGRSVLVDRKGKLIAGNKSTEAYANGGNNDVIVVPTDGTKLVVVQRTDLDLDRDHSARELGLLDNRSNEVSLSWDAQILQDMQADGIDVGKAFDPHELDMIVAIEETNAAAAAGSAEAPLEFPKVDESIRTDHQCPKCGYEFSGNTKKLA